MRRNSRSLHPVARRVAMASMTVLAASGIGLVAAPMAFGQIVIPLGGPLLGGGQTSTVTNSGSASANSGGNTAVGNGSSNTIGVTTPAGAVSVPVSVGNLTNTSDGSSTITSGSATAVGNSSDTAAGQSNGSGNVVSSFLGGQAQASGVTNAGSASANSGGNTAVGNGSKNTQTVTQNVTGGLVGVGVTVGAPTNNSTGTATITSGAANAAGNISATNVGQSALQGGGGPGGGPAGFGAGPGAAPCSTGRFTPLQDVAVRNQGQALADTGNNSATGNASTNNNTIEVTGTGATGGVAGVGLTIGAPVNNSSGTAVITTGPATAVGNSSTTQVGQTVCPQVTTLAGGRPGVIVPAGRVAAGGTLARTGLDTGDLGMMAGALVGVGILLMASQRRRVAARTAAVPMAGLGLGLGGDDWDRFVG